MTLNEAVKQLEAMLGYYLLSQPEIDAIKFAISALSEQEEGKMVIDNLVEMVKKQ